MTSDRSIKTIMQPALSWFSSKGWTPLPYQERTWEAFLAGKHGIVNAPTGSGKTYSLLLPAVLEAREWVAAEKARGPVIVWVAPIRALTKEIKQAAERAITGMGMDWSVGIRSGDTSTAEREKQWKSAPQILITTPESLHILLAKKGYPDYFADLTTFVVDEWHELIGSKRGIQTQLALARLRRWNPGNPVDDHGDGRRGARECLADQLWWHG